MVKVISSLAGMMFVRLWSMREAGDPHPRSWRKRILDVFIRDNATPFRLLPRGGVNRQQSTETSQAHREPMSCAAKRWLPSR